MLALLRNENEGLLDSKLDEMTASGYLHTGRNVSRRTKALLASILFVVSSASTV